MGNKEDGIKLTFIGDLLASDTDYTIGVGISSNIDSLLKYYGEQEKSPLVGSELVISNLESPLITDISRLQMPFAGNPAIINLLKILNISVITIANNHILDHGIDGFYQTISLLSKNGFKFIGSIEDSLSRITILEQRNYKIALAGFTAFPARLEKTFLAPIEQDILLGTLKQIKKLSPDYIIYSFHWGNEYVNIPSPSQVKLAHDMVDMGVDIIIGHHPHVIQPVERYKNGLIFYSLGNFLFDMFWSENVRNGIIAEIILGDKKEPDYNIRHFRINSDFTLDTVNIKEGVKILARANTRFSQMLQMPVELYEKKYKAECKKRRLLARFLMKVYLVRNIINLSPQSRKLIAQKLEDYLIKVWRRS